MSNTMHNQQTQTTESFAPMDAKLQSRPESMTTGGFSDVGDVNQQKQWGTGQQQWSQPPNDNVQLIGPGEQRGLQGPGTSQEFQAQSQGGDWSGQPSDKWGPNQQQWSTQPTESIGQAPIEPHHERLPRVDFDNQPTSEILGRQPDQSSLGDASLGAGGGQLNVPVVTTTTVTETREMNIPLTTAPWTSGQQIPVGVPLAQPVTQQHTGHPNLPVFEQAAKKAGDFNARVEEREREAMLRHEAAELEHKKKEWQFEKEQLKHEKEHQKALKEEDMHRNLVQSHGEEMERQHARHAREQEALKNLVVKHTEEMREAHEAHLKKLEALKDLVLQHTHDMKQEQQDHLNKQEKHHDLMKLHSQKIEDSQLAAQQHAQQAELAKKKKEEEQILKENQKELKHEHQETVEQARQMPGGSGVLGGIKDVAHKAKVAVGTTLGL